MNETKQKTEYETHVVKPDVNFMIGDQAMRIISIEDEFYLDGKINELQEFTDNNHGLGKSEQEKDELYFTAQTTWRQMVERLKSMKYSFYLNRKQYQFLTNLLISKLEYTVDTVFYAIELTEMLGNWETSKDKSESDTKVQCYTADCTDITYMYHLIAKHTVKGLTNDTYRFTEILKIIGKISKVVSYFDEKCKSWNKDIQDWASTFYSGIFVDGKTWGRNESQQLGVTSFGQKVSEAAQEFTDTVQEKTETKTKKSKKKEEEVKE